MSQRSQFRYICKTCGDSSHLMNGTKCPGLIIEKVEELHCICTTYYNYVHEWNSTQFQPCLQCGKHLDLSKPDSTRNIRFINVASSSRMRF